MPDETLPDARQPDESAPTAEHPAETPTVEQPDASHPATEGSDTHTAAVRVRHMADSGEVEMTLGQLLALFNREDSPADREEVSDELFVEGLVARPLLENAKYGEKVRVTKVEDATTPSRRKASRTTLPLVGVLVAAFLALYFHGNLDRVFYPVGLNFNECARNGLGATFCGKELDEYRARLERVKAEGEAAQAKIKEESARRQQESEAEERKNHETRAREQREYLTTAKRQQEALAAREAKIQSEGEEAQAKIKEESEETQAKLKEEGEEAQAQIP
jgi:hypothetical protein